MDKWLETNEIKDTITSFELVSTQLQQVISEPNHWKWVIIGLHNALQGLMVLALQSSNFLNVLREKHAKQWLEAYESGSRNYPDAELDTFLNLYEKIKSEKMKLYANSIRFIPTESQEQSIEKLHSFRNGFIHFVPKEWLIELDGLPKIISDCLDVANFLAFECNNIYWKDDLVKSKIKEYITLSKHSIYLIKEKYDKK